jgi:pyridoxal phosphate phosphatase PHOSPHO2
MQHHGLENFFEEIVTNPAQWLPNGMLQLKRRVDPAGVQHGCKIGCSANMCKGELLRLV